MNNQNLPVAWEEFFGKLAFFPVVVKSLDRIHDTAWSMEKNIHGHYEMVYIKRGSVVFEISGNEVNLSPNSIVIIKPYQWHKFSVRTKACEFIVLSFAFADPNNARRSDVPLTYFIDYFRNADNSAYITMQLGPKNEISNVMHRILREREKGEEWNELLSCLLIIELFLLISRTLKLEHETGVRSRGVSLKESLHQAKTYIDQHYSKDLSLSDVARYIYLSESYFAHTFKAEFGISPKSYILKVRINSALDLLARTESKISDIALSVGFSSQQRFNDIFRKYTQLTPLKYRRQAKLERMNKSE